MKDNLTKAFVETKLELNVFLVKYLRTKNGVLFRLSNGTLQLNLFDHTKLILEDMGEKVTFIDRERFFALTRVVTTRSLLWWCVRGDQGVLERLGYFRDIIQQMIK